MKKLMLLTIALGFAGATSIVAGTIDVFITGSTAFRANVYTACQKLYVGGSPTVYYGDAAHGGAGSGFSSSTAVWAMTGNPITSLTNIQGNTLVIHGNFTGSIQGLQTTEQGTLLVWANAHGSAGGNCDTYSTNAPTIGFSDASGTASPFPATGNFLEESVCVQPFVFCKSVASGIVSNINNVTWEQFNYGIKPGRIPLSAWTGKAADTNSFVYLMERTKDSGTRRCFTQGEYYQYNDPVGVWLFDYTNHFWYQSTNLTTTTTASSPNGVAGPAGFNNVNLNWGSGFVGGGDIRTSLANTDPGNQAIACLSIGDAKSLGSSNWAQVITYNGLWPTGAGAGIHGNTATNTDYSPIIAGFYPIWGFEVLVHPENPGAAATTIPGQNLTYGQLGDNTTPGSFMGVFNAQSYLNGGVVSGGSIENEIVLAQSAAGGATAIPLVQMLNSRPNVSGTIFPPFQ